MTRRRRIVSLLSLVALTATLAAPAAQAASALYYSNNGGLTQTQSGPGLATVSYSDSGKFGTASGYEFLGGVGVSAFAHTNGSATNGYQNMQVVSGAGFGDAFRVGTNTPGLVNAGAGVFELTFGIEASGTVDATGALEPRFYDVDTYSSAQGEYHYSWNVGGFTGGGGVDLRFKTNGLTGVDVSGDGPAGLFGAVLLVRLGEIVNLSLNAGAHAVADGYAPATGTADFGHTLRWGGITNIRFRPDGAAEAIELPDGFDLTLLSDTTGFDYRNAAGPNPYTSGVPEPAAWALMILGFGAAGVALRRRNRATADC